MYWWQDSWSPKLPYCDHWGHLCFEWKVEAFTGSTSISHRRCSLWPCQKGFKGYTASWPRTRRNNSPNIWDRMFFFSSLLYTIKHWTSCCFSRSSELLYRVQVYPMYKAFIEPDLQTAHIKIINKFNPFTGFQSPTYILKVNLHFF